jgi:hypothetical protein
MNTSKDFIKFRQYVRSLSLSINEQYMLEYLFEYTNVQYGYAYPKFSDLLLAFSTTSKNRISSILKKLEKKKLLIIDRSFTNNRYYVIGIENFINQSKHNDKNGTKAPLTGQVSIEDLTPDESKVVELTGMTQNQARRLLELSKNKVDKVISTIEYALKNKASNVFGYVKFLLSKGINVDDKRAEHKKKSIPFIDNCSSREYSEEYYQSIEERLLGWA